MNLLEFVKINQQKIALIMGFLLIACLGFVLGRITAYKYSAPEIKIDEAFANPYNNSQNLTISQTAGATNGGLDCQGKIKGSSSLIYHMPGGAFYTKTTNPIRCFDTEDDAKAAGFRKSQR